MSREDREKLLQELYWEVRAEQVARDAVDEAVQQIVGLNRTDSRCIDIIDREGRVTAGQLAEESGLTTGAVTAVLDRLEAAGFARRVRDTGDRRKVFVELTEKARMMGEACYGDIAREAFELVKRYSDAELALLRDFLREGRRMNERQLAKLRSCGPQAWAEHQRMHRDGGSDLTEV